MNVSSVPEMMPGIDSGIVTVRKVVNGDAYRSAPASMYRVSIRSSTAYSGSVMNGMKLYVKPNTTAKGVPVMCPSGGSTESALGTGTTGPSSENNCFQASVRSRKLMKNGAITSVSSRLCSSGQRLTLTPMK